MPVLKIYYARFERLTGLTRKQILDRLPYIGLDIEGTESDSVRIEYNPNRPDFSTDYGIARAIRGLVGKELGVKAYRARTGRVQVFADKSVAKVRPFIACAVARGTKLDEETVRQLISMQEDLHNGLGRKRRKVSIGLHNLDAVVPPITYGTRDAGFSFIPLGSSEHMSVKEILEKTETGLAYGKILEGATAYPMLYDSKGVVLSFPPIINGQATKVDAKTKNLFVDVTSTDERLGNEALAILCSALADAGGALETVTINTTKGKVATPQLAPTKMKFDVELAQAITGIPLTKKDAKNYLRRSRLDLDGKGFVSIPRYRVDIIHPVDLAEEVAIGYGLDKMTPSYPPSANAGQLDPSVSSLERMCQTMAEAGFNETMSYDLVDEPTLYGNFVRTSWLKLEVENPRSMEHHLLRDSLIPSLMAVLGRNTKNTYPQMVFEAGRIFYKERDKPNEAFSLAALSAHTDASFTEAKMQLDALAKRHFGASIETRPGSHWAFTEGRCAHASVNKTDIGYIGEVTPHALAAFGVDVQVAGFEIRIPKKKPSA